MIKIIYLFLFVRYDKAFHNKHFLLSEDNMKVVDLSTN